MAISFAIKGNIEQLQEVAKTEGEIIYVTGGMTKNDLWLEILADVTNKTVLSTRFFEGTSMGGVICTSVSLGVYTDFTEAAEHIVCFKNQINPDEKKVEIYKRTYHTWKTWYDKLGEF